MRYLFIGLLSLLVSCTGLPDGVDQVTGFDKQRYLGTWHEIARLDHSFERGLEKVTATYAVRDDGAISVLNRGYDIEDQQWRHAEGVAKPVSSVDVAHLKVSFFGPFYGTYAVFELADDYSHAFVAGFNTDYLWLLARESTVSEAVRQRFITRADELGFDVDALIWLDGS